MTLQEALKIGSSADGYIKCTYAKVQSRKGGFHWSLQGSHFRSNKAKTDFESAVSDALVETIVVEDFPVVTASAINPDGKTVDALLTDYAKNKIRTKLYTKRGKKHKVDLAFTEAIDKAFLAKEVAFDWIPTDCKFTVELDQQIAQAKQKLDNAKALLAAAGAIAII